MVGDYSETGHFPSKEVPRLHFMTPVGGMDIVPFLPHPTQHFY